MTKKQLVLLSGAVIVLLVGLTWLSFSWLTMSDTASKPNSQATETGVVSTYPTNVLSPFIVPTLAVTVTREQYNRLFDLPTSTDVNAKQVVTVTLEEYNRFFDPYNFISYTLKSADIVHWLEEAKTNPDKLSTIRPFMPFPILNNLRGYIMSGISVMTDLWLTDHRYFKGAGMYLSIFPDSIVKTNEVIITVLLDGQPIKFKIDNEDFATSYKMVFKRTERRIYTLETEDLPIGAHLLSILYFPATNTTNPDPIFQASRGQSLGVENYRVYVGDTKPTDQVQFENWSNLKSPNPDLQDNFAISYDPKGFDTNNSPPSIPLWKQLSEIKAGQTVTYTLVLNNTAPYDREYCLVAFMDFQLVPIVGQQKRICGIVKAGYSGILNYTFTAPSTPGPHRFEVLRIDNPLMKESYFKWELKDNFDKLSEVRSSGRAFFTVS